MVDKRVESKKRREEKKRRERDGQNEGNRLEEGAIKNDDDDSFLIRCLPEWVLLSSLPLYVVSLYLLSIINLFLYILFPSLIFAVLLQSSYLSLSWCLFPASLWYVLSLAFPHVGQGL